MNSWKNKLLNQGGKEVLLKAVSMPVYTMSCFKLPNKLCKEVTSIFANYWWGEIRYTGAHGGDWLKRKKKRRFGFQGFAELQQSLAG